MLKKNNWSCLCAARKPSSIFKVLLEIKNIFGDGSLNNTCRIPNLVKNGQEFSTNRQKSELLADVLAQSFSTDFTRFHPSDSAKGFKPPSISSADEIPVFTDIELTQCEKKLKKYSAPGSDDVCYHQLRISHGSTSFLSAMLKFYVFTIFNGKIPHAWKVAKVKMIPKKGKDLLSPESYRPISL